MYIAICVYVQENRDENQRVNAHNGDDGWHAD